MTPNRMLPAALLGASLLLAACGPRHADLARGGAAATPAVTVAPSPSATPSPTDTATPTPAPATPSPPPPSTPVPTPRPPTASPAPPAFTLFPLPNTAPPGYTMAPAALVAGADGNLWWVDGNSDAVGRTTPRGVTTAFRIPGGVQPRTELVAAPDGSLWGATMNNRLLHITMTGAITVVDVPASVQWNGPYHLTMASDGALWYVGGGSSQGLYRRDPTGTTTTYQPQGSNPVSLTWGPDGALWFGETVSGGQSIARFDPATSTVTHYAVPGPPDFIGPLVVAGGDLWFGENTRGKVGRITPQGALTEFALPRYGGQQLTVRTAMIVGRDGALWAAAAQAGVASPVLVRVTLAGATQVVPVTVGGSEAFVTDPAEGPDGHVWMLSEHGYQASTGVSDLVRDNLG